MANLTVLERSPDPETHDPGKRWPSIAERIRSLGQSRLGALLLLLRTVAAIVWANLHRELGDRLRYVWRHAPLDRYHPNAVAAAEASEAASLQGKFFEMERSLLLDQENQLPSDIVRRAAELGLDVDRFERDLVSPEVAGRVRDDVLDAEAMDISAVPTFFVNGRRHTGPYDAQSLIRALTSTAEVAAGGATAGERATGESPAQS